MERKFLHTLDPEKDSKGYCQTYEIAGVVWSGYEYTTWDWLRYRINDSTEVEIELETKENRFRWRYRMKLSESAYFDSTGYAPTIDEACHAALAYVPETATIDYLGRSFIWYGCKRGDSIDWTSCIDGDEAKVQGPWKHGEEPEYFMWERNWEPAKPVLERMRYYSHHLEGKKPTLQEALIAVIDAPDEFIKACGKLVSNLNHNQQFLGC